MEFNRNGYWAKKDVDDAIVGVVKVENDFEYFNYKNGEWLRKKNDVVDIGINPDWEKISEKEAFSALGIK